MSYDVQLYSIKTKHKEMNAKDEHFFDEPSKLEKFTNEQFLSLKQRLQVYGYVLTDAADQQYHFEHNEHAIIVLLTDSGLYFHAAFEQEAIFEAGMTCSEFTDTDEFAKYDPQQGGWEA